MLAIGLPSAKNECFKCRFKKGCRTTYYQLILDVLAVSSTGAGQHNVNVLFHKELLDLSGMQVPGFLGT